MHASAAVRTSFGFVGLAILCLVFADIEITTHRTDQSLLASSNRSV